MQELQFLGCSNRTSLPPLLLAGAFEGIVQDSLLHSAAVLQVHLLQAAIDQAMVLVAGQGAAAEQ